MPDPKRDEAERLLQQLEAVAHLQYVRGDTRHKEARAAVIAAMTRATPDGWRLVPVSATEAMLKEMCELDCVREECRPHLTCSNPVKRFRFQETYARALAAAPEAP